MAVVTQWVNCAAVENPNSSQTCRQRRQSTAVFRINSGADALAPAQRAPRPPGRPVELWKDLILREKIGTGASRADQGVRPTKSMQDPAYGKLCGIAPEGAYTFSGLRGKKPLRYRRGSERTLISQECPSPAQGATPSASWGVPEKV